MAANYAVVTGVIGGIGSAIARCLRENDYCVIGLDNLSRTEGQLEGDEYVRFNLKKLTASKEERKKLKNKITAITGGAPIKVLVNNAAVQIIEPIRALSYEKWQSTLDINLTAPFLLTRLLINELEAASGSVINLSSVHAQSTKPGFLAYTTSKSALEGMTRAMAVDLGSKVRINAIRPAATETPMLLEGFKNDPSSYEELSRMHPLERIADPIEIANVVVFLASESASFITGTIVNVDGGILARLHDPN